MMKSNVFWRNIHPSLIKSKFKFNTKQVANTKLRIFMTVVKASRNMKHVIRKCKKWAYRWKNFSVHVLLPYNWITGDCYLMQN